MSRGAGRQRYRVLYLVPAGGAGSRLMPHTHSLPKPMFPMGGKRLIDFALEEARPGLLYRLVTVNSGMRKLEAYIQARYRGVEIVQENKQLGTAGSLRTPYIRDLLDAVDAVLVTPADHVSFTMTRLDAVRQLLATEFPAGQIVVSPRVAYGDSVAVDTRGRIVAVSPDPGKHPFSSTGIFVFSSAYLREWLKSHHEGLPNVDFYRDLFMPVCADGQCLGIRQSPRYWDDVGTPERYWLNAMLLASGRPVYSGQARPADRSLLTRCIVIGDGDLRGRTFTDSIISWNAEGALQVTQLTIGARSTGLEPGDYGKPLVSW